LQKCPLNEMVGWDLAFSLDLICTDGQCTDDFYRLSHFEIPNTTKQKKNY